MAVGDVEGSTSRTDPLMPERGPEDAMHGWLGVALGWLLAAIGIGVMLYLIWQ